MPKSERKVKKRQLNSDDSDYDAFDELPKNKKFNGNEKDVEEENLETVQDRKIKLAKLYLKEIENEKNRDHEKSESNSNYVSNRIKRDYLENIGKLHKPFADHFITCNLDKIKHLEMSKNFSTITCICLSNDNQFLITGSKKSLIVKWCLSSGKMLCSRRFRKNDSDCHQKQINCIAISHDDKFIAVGDETNIIRIWNMKLELITKLSGHRSSVTGLIFRNNSLDLYSASKDKTVKIWSLKEMMEIETLFGHEHHIRSIDSSYGDEENVKVITTGGQDCTIRVWKIVTESQLVFFNKNVYVDIAKFINNDYFVTGSNNGDLALWKCNKKEPIVIKKAAHSKWIVSLGVLKNSNLIASGSNDGTIILWKIDKFKSFVELMRINAVGFINSLCFTSDSKILIAAIGREHRFGRWDVLNASSSVMIIPISLHDK